MEGSRGLYFLNILGHFFLLNLKQIERTFARVGGGGKLVFQTVIIFEMDFQMSGTQRYYLPGSYLVKIHCLWAESKAPPESH